MVCKINQTAGWIHLTAVFGVPRRRQKSGTAQPNLTTAQAYGTSAMCILQFNLVSTYNFMQVELQLLEPAWLYSFCEAASAFAAEEQMHKCKFVFKDLVSVNICILPVCNFSFTVSLFLAHQMDTVNAVARKCENINPARQMGWFLNHLDLSKVSIW